MLIKKQLIVLFVFLFSTSFLLSCEQVNHNEVAQENQKTKPANSPAGKPSAPIQLTHNYDGLSQAGELEPINLNFTSGLDGELQVSISSKDNITTDGDITLTQNIKANEAITIPVTIYLANEGKHYLNINTQLIINSNIQSKSFALAVSTQTIKNKAQETTKAEDSKNEEPKNNIIIMEADENIRQE